MRDIYIQICVYTYMYMYICTYTHANAHTLHTHIYPICSVSLENINTIAVLNEELNFDKKNVESNHNNFKKYILLLTNFLLVHFFYRTLSWHSSQIKFPARCSKNVLFFSFIELITHYKYICVCVMFNGQFLNVYKVANNRACFIIISFIIPMNYIHNIPK